MSTAQIWQAYLIASILCHMISPTISISAHRIRVAHFAGEKKHPTSPAYMSFKHMKRRGNGKAKAPFAGIPKQAPCAMCLYLMETLDKNIGIGEQLDTGEFGGEGSSPPPHAVHWPQSLPPTLNMPGFASPLGNQPLTHDAIAGPGFSLLETASSLRGARPTKQQRARAADQETNPVLLQTGSSVSNPVNSVQRMLGFMVCRPGTKYCRPKLLQMGARAAQRKLRMQSAAREQQDMQGAMIQELEGHCQEHLPEAYRVFCGTVSQKIIEVAGEMIHDYSDDEICSDIGMCDNEALGIPGEPGMFS